MDNDRKIVAVCTSRIFDAQQHVFLKELCERLAERDIIVMIFCTNTDLYWEENKYFPEASVFDTVPFDLTDLLLIMDEKIKSRRISGQLIERASEHGVPVIVVDGEYDGTVEVEFDYRKGFEKVVRHIIEFHGAKKPHFIAGIEGNHFSDERIEIFRQVIEENGIPFSPDMVSYGAFWAGPAREATEKLLESGNIPDAVICANDIMAINVQDVLIRAGLRVPEDVIVSGFDGIDEVNFCTPRLTTASCGSDALAAAVAENIIDCLDGDIPEKVYVEPVLIPNGSCGCHCAEESTMTALNRFNDGFYRYQDDIRMMYEISTAMQMSPDPQSAAKCLSHPLMHDIHCFVYSACLEKETDYFSAPVLASESEKYVIFWESDRAGAAIKTADMSKRREFVMSSVKNGCPMIINTLDYLGKPMGYICYTFDNYNFIDYAKTASVTNTVSMGLGGFIRGQYQRYLSGKVEIMYRTDPLTGLYNRIGFGAEFERMRSSEELCGKPVTVIMADLDGLKYINDTFGHKAGDRAIALAASALMHGCPEGAVCVRFGGDEMIAMIVGGCDPDGVTAKIDSELARINSERDMMYRVSVSCGAYSSVLDEHFDISNAVRLADEKMYRNKRSRKLKFDFPS